LTHLDKASAVTTYADKLVEEANKWKDNPDAQAGKVWYKNVGKFVKKGFGADAEMFAHLLAATSAGQGVMGNWADAFEAYRMYQTGAYDSAIREYKRTGVITQDMKPKKENGKYFYTNSDEVLKVLAGTWYDQVQGPKTPNFLRNLLGKGKDATIDLWAARTMRRLGHEGVEDAPDQYRISPASETGVSDLDFAFSQQVFKQAASKLGMDAHELQGMMWYAEKSHWVDKGYTPASGAGGAKKSYVPMLKAYAEAPTMPVPSVSSWTAGVRPRK
jgi:hypothetical protein